MYFRLRPYDDVLLLSSSLNALSVLPECLLSALSHPEVIMKNLRPKDEDCVLYTNFHQTDKRRFAFLELLLEPKMTNKFRNPRLQKVSFLFFKFY